MRRQSLIRLEGKIMDRLEKLIRDIQRQLSPYDHEHDIERGAERWEVGTQEYITAWIAGQIRNCHQRNRCDKKGLCIFYNYRDLAKRNYDICYEIMTRLETGGISCTITAPDSG
jgi:hypothetical protein